MSHQVMPNVPLYVGYAWDSGHVRLSTLLRNVRYVDQLTGLSHDVFGHGLKLTGNAQFEPVNIVWMGQWGRGSASTFKDNADLGLDLVPDQHRPGQLTPTTSWGYLTAAQWDITPRAGCG